MGGKGSTTTGELPPEVRGLFSSSSRQVQQAQAASPLSDYMGSYREGVAPLTPLERHSIGQAISLNDVANGPNAMALRSYMSLPELAAAGPTTGQYNPSNTDLRTYMDFLRGPGYGQVGPEADYPGYNDLPILGPELRSDAGGNSGPGRRTNPPIVQPTPDMPDVNPTTQSDVPYAPPVRGRTTTTITRR